MRAAIHEVAQGTDARKALANVAGKSWKSLEEDWRKELTVGPEPPSARLLPRYLKGEANENDELSGVELDRARKYVRLGDLLWSRSRPGAASAEYAKAHRVAPSDPVVASRFARSALAGGKPEDAIAPLEQTLRLYPAHAPAHSALAAARFRTGAAEGARNAAMDAIAHNPFDPLPHCILARLDVPQATLERDLCEQLGGATE